VGKISVNTLTWRSEGVTYEIRKTFNHRQEAIVMSEMMNRIKEIEETCKKYGFMDRKVSPYSFWIKVKDLIAGWKDYDECTRCSQQVIDAEVRGFEKILHSWICYEQEPLIKVRIKVGKNTGNIVDYHKSTADELVAIGMAEVV
jgi:hypothetical protein